MILKLMLERGYNQVKKKTKRQLFASISALVFVLCFVNGDLNNKVLHESRTCEVGKKSKKGGK